MPAYKVRSKVRVIADMYCVPMLVYKVRSKVWVTADMYMSLLAVILVAGRLAPPGGYISLLLVEACFRGI